jgi:hypothetical protein
MEFASQGLPTALCRAQSIKFNFSWKLEAAAAELRYRRCVLLYAFLSNCKFLI